MSSYCSIEYFFSQKHIALPVLFTAFGLIQIIYYLIFYIPVLRKKKEEALQNFEKPVSVVIAAHNEEDNLKQFLPFILEQDYPIFEVIVVNDRSSDNTENVINQFKKKYPHLKSRAIKEGGLITYGKKLAVTIGIRASENAYILLTDADCKPISKHWIKEMCTGLKENDVVLGYGPYFKEKRLLNKYIRYETSNIALQYISYAKAKVPYMGIGRNLAYKKDLFIEHKGFINHSHIHSGDDDLFINEISSKAKIGYNISPNSFVYSTPKKNWKTWKLQKQRHLTTFSMYKKKHLILLSTETYSRIGFYLLLPLVLLLFPSSYLVWITLSLRLILFIFIQVRWNQKIIEQDLPAYAVLFDLINPLLNLYLYLSSNKRNNKW